MTQLKGTNVTVHYTNGGSNMSSSLCWMSGALLFHAYLYNDHDFTGPSSFRLAKGARIMTDMESGFGSLDCREPAGNNRNPVPSAVCFETHWRSDIKY